MENYFNSINYIEEDSFELAYIMVKESLSIHTTLSFFWFTIWPNTKKSSKRIILLAKKGGIGPTELLPGLKLYNSKGVESKKASLLSEEGILNFY